MVIISTFPLLNTFRLQCSSKSFSLFGRVKFPLLSCSYINLLTTCATLNPLHVSYENSRLIGTGFEIDFPWTAMS